MTTRNIRPFVHLRVLSSYSLGLGLSSPGDMCRHARRAGFDAVAITDVSGTYGFVEFHRAARETGIKPIYGTLVFLDWSGPGGAHEPVQSLIVLALDRHGLRNVCAVASAGALRRERREPLFAAHLDGMSDGVIAITRVDPRTSGVTARHLLGPLHEMFGDRLFLECRAGLSGDDQRVQNDAIADASGLGVSCVLTQDVRFVGPARPQLFDLMSTLDEPGFEHRVFSDRRAGDSSPDHAMATAAEVSNAYDEFPEAYTNASLIAALVQPDLFDLLDEPPAPASGDMFTAARQDASLRSRVHALNDVATARASKKEREQARAHIDHELDLISQTGIEETMLRFERLAGLLRDVGARLGPATGLSVQSRCAFLLGITSYDPYAVDARFEPSFDTGDRWGSVFDVQISTEDRPAVLAIVNRAFTGASVGYVPIVEHLTAARSMRMVAKWLGTPGGEIEEAVKAATRVQGVTLRELAEDNRAFAALYRRSAPFRELVAHAASVEGLPWGYTRAKRTVIVSPRPLREFFGYTVSPTTGDHFVQATRDSFPLGAVLRIDLSLLRMLAILPAAKGREPVDPNAYDLIAAQDLEGIHLLESAPGRLAPSFGIRGFEDLVHFAALIRWRRSGMSLANRLAAFRAGPRPVPAEPLVGELLAATSGMVLFRDQLRDVAAALAGWTRPEASVFLSRLSDHAPGNLAAARQEFFRRTVEQSVSLEDATEWFARLVRESARAVDRQRVIADCLLTERCLHMKFTRRDEFLRRLAEHAEGRVRYETPARVTDSAETAEEPAPAPPGLEPLATARSDEPIQGNLLGAVTVPESSSAKFSPGRNPKQGFHVLTTVSELYPHPASTPVRLTGRIRNLQTFNNSASQRVGYFELIDSSGSARIFVPAAPFSRFADAVREGNDVIVRGTVRLRDGRKVCDALEIEGSEGGVDLGQASAHESAAGDP